MFSSTSSRALQPTNGGSRQASSAAGKDGKVDVSKWKYPHRLNFYERAPNEEITIEQFESWAIDRLKGELYGPREQASA